VVGIPLLYPRCYLAEWYRPDLTEEPLHQIVTRLNEGARAMCAAGSPVQLIWALAVPSDELVFGVFAAGSKQIVTRVCQRAGVPAQRLSVAIDARAARQP
jgi:hypothetical protein